MRPVKLGRLGLNALFKRWMRCFFASEWGRGRYVWGASLIVLTVVLTQLVTGIVLSGRGGERDGSLAGMERRGRGIGSDSSFEVTWERAPPRSRNGNIGLRALVITGGTRVASFMRLLASLEAGSDEGDRVDVDIWVEPPSNQDVGFMPSVRSFNWSHGRLRVLTWTAHAGLRKQWIDTWHNTLIADGHREGLSPQTHEHAIILEDDIEVSPFYWRWLKAAHAAYAMEPRIAAVTLERARTCEAFCGDLEGGPFPFFAYRLVGTWGWSPKPDHMYRFRRWYHDLPATFDPTVDGLIRSKWFRERLVSDGHMERMWSMHHVKYADTHADGYTLYVKLDGLGTLATNHVEPGLNYGDRKYNVTLRPCSRAAPICPSGMTCSFEEGYCRGLFAKSATPDPKRHIYPFLVSWDTKYTAFPVPSTLPFLEWDAKSVPDSAFLPTGAIPWV